LTPAKLFKIIKKNQFEAKKKELQKFSKALFKHKNKSKCNKHSGGK
jgi:hypothetical protein